MVNDLLLMYSDPKTIMMFVKEDVFKKEFWNNISYQTADATAAYNGKNIDEDTFINTLMQELTNYKAKNLRTATNSNKKIKLKEGEILCDRRQETSPLARHPHGYINRERWPWD